MPLVVALVVALVVGLVVAVYLSGLSNNLSAYAVSRLSCFEQVVGW